jgi:hypothetical protein
LETSSFVFVMPDLRYLFDFWKEATNSMFGSLFLTTSWRCIYPGRGDYRRNAGQFERSRDIGEALFVFVDGIGEKETDHRTLLGEGMGALNLEHITQKLIRPKVSGRNGSGEQNTPRRSIDQRRCEETELGLSE